MAVAPGLVTESGSMEEAAARMGTAEAPMSILAAAAVVTAAVADSCSANGPGPYPTSDASGVPWGRRISKGPQFKWVAGLFHS